MTTHFLNPLDQFQSHSIHYVVLAARSTQDVVEFTVDSQAAQSASLSAIDSAKQLGDQIKFGRASAVYLMMDTRRFSQYQISDFSLETLMTGVSSPGGGAPTNTAVNMKFTVIDSTGISFANFLQYLMDQKLQVSFDGMTVLIRVLFIGHRDDGYTEVVQSLTIPAIFKKIQVDLNDVKGIYQCELYPMIGMGSNSATNSKWTSIGAASSYFTGESSNKLGAVVNAFETRLNEESIERYRQMNGQTASGGKKKTVGRWGRPVQYMITLPKGWGEFAFSGPSQGAAVETVFKELVKKEAESANSIAEAQKKAQKNANAPAKDSHIAVSPNLTVTEVLDVIFSQCLEVQRLGNFTKKQDQDGNLRFYKHLITATSDDDSFTVHVDVVEFVVPNVDLATKTKAVGDIDAALYTQIKLKDGTLKRVPKQYLELDYIFSGTNIDVLSMDLKIENLNYLLMQGSKLGAGDLNSRVIEGQKQEDGESIVADEHPVFGRRSKDPMLIPVRSHSDNSNYSNLAANAPNDSDDTPQSINAQYMQNLQAFYSLGPVEAKLQLRGNPDLMVMVALQSIPQHVSALTISNDGSVSSKANPAVKEKYRAEFEAKLLKLNGVKSVTEGSPINTQMLTSRNFVSTPVFVKVNVYGPNVDFVTGAPNGQGARPDFSVPGTDYAQQLFYDNYYWCNKVTSKIEGAKFTQELSLRPFSVYNYPSTAAKGADVSTVRSAGDRPRGGQ